MKRRESREIKILFFSLIAIAFLSGCSNDSSANSNNSSGEWAFKFVVWDGYIYRLSDEYVDDVVEEIGEVTNHSVIEETYSGNFLECV